MQTFTNQFQCVKEVAAGKKYVHVLASRFRGILILYYINNYRYFYEYFS